MEWTAYLVQVGGDSEGGGLSEGAEKAGGAGGESSGGEHRSRRWGWRSGELAS